MSVRILVGDEPFPDPARAVREGLLAVGGDLRPERLLEAYRRGIFPWYEEGQPILWFSPDPRFVLRAEELRLSRSLRKALAGDPYEIRLDTAFEAVIDACARVPRPGQEGTWITREMVRAYVRLHRLGWAHSAEAWRGGELVGGLYGVSIGGLFCGESMFARADDASKIAFVRLVRQLDRWGIATIDCQVPTDHLARFGARPWPRRDYLRALPALVSLPSRPGPWRFDAELSVVQSPRSREGRVTPSDRDDVSEIDLGIPALDAEHRGQLDLMNRLGDVLAAGRPSGEVTEDLGRLVAYLEAHFLSEQILMREQAYPAYQAHQREHDQAISLLRDLKARCDAGDAKVTAEALAALRGWLLAHVQTTDRQLAEFMSARGVNLP